MDNVTHALAGMLVAEAACVWRRESRPHVRAAAYLVSAVANNLPDLDIVYTWVTRPRPLGSLLHHRGHTHTLLVALVGAWLLGLATFRWFSRRHADASARERRLFLGLSLGGALLHLTMDFGNNYGVHPFWPLSVRWFYGDSIFIVEPLWLAVAIPILSFTLTARWLRLLLWVILWAVLVVCWLLPFVGLGARLTLLGVTVLAFLIGRGASERPRIMFALGAWLTVPLVFAVASGRAKAELRQAARAAFPALRVLDIATTPMPASPACWEALVAGEQGGTYHVLRASVALAPLTAAQCSAGRDVEPTAHVRQLSRAGRGGVRWLTEYKADIASLAQLRRDDCRFRAMLQFARLPYVAASGLAAGDLRYDRTPGRDFSDVELPRQASSSACPRLVPGWAEPRSDLFQP